MKIALITQREDVNQYGMPIDIMESTYINFFNQLGYRTLPVSNYESCAEEWMDIVNIDLLVLTGGGSLPDNYYKGNYGYTKQPHRDMIEGRLLQKALENRVAILAVCRGMQFVNGYFGGKVSKLEYLAVPRKNGEDHPVEWINGRQIYVNNYHNDGIYLKDLAQQAEVLAMDVENCTVEAFKIPKKKLLALQWHPERLFKSKEAQDKSIKIVKTFLGL